MALPLLCACSKPSRVKGVLFDEVAERPVEGVVISLVGARKKFPLLEGLEHTRADARTDAQGGFRFDALPHGRYRLESPEADLIFPAQEFKLTKSGRDVDLGRLMVVDINSATAQLGPLCTAAFEGAPVVAPDRQLQRDHHVLRRRDARKDWTYERDTTWLRLAGPYVLCITDTVHRGHQRTVEGEIRGTTMTVIWNVRMFRPALPPRAARGHASVTETMEYANIDRYLAKLGAQLEDQLE